jgi:hypothetical protein
LLVNTLKNIQYDADKQKAKLTLKNGYEATLDDFIKHYSIDSISFTEEYFSSSTTKEWYFKTNGKVYSTLGASRTSDEINFMNAFTKIKMVLTKTNKDWDVTDLYCYPSNYGSVEKYTQKSYSGMICEVGFEGVLYKTTPFNPHYSNEFVKNEFYKKMYDLFSKTYQNKGSNFDEVLEYFSPKNPNRKEQCQNFVDYIKELNAKCIEIKKEDNKFDILTNIDFQSDNKKVFTIRFSAYRPNCNWDGYKQYKNIYKDAGMSASVLKSTGGMFDSSIDLKFTLVAIDNMLYIESFDYENAKSIEIPF